MTGGIYEIRNRITGNAYVGRAKCFAVRFKRHRYELRCGRHHCLPLQRAWDKHGEAAFDFVVVQECPPEAAIVLEARRLKCLSGLYNVSRRASGGDLISGHPQREAIVSRIRASLLERYRQMDTAQRQRVWGRPGQRNGMFGRKHTPAAKAAISARLKGKGGPTHGNFGLKRTETTRQKLSRIASARTGKANAFYGRQHSEQTRAKITASKQGQKPTNMRPVWADGQLYPSVTEAARCLDISTALVIYRIKSPKYAYRYQEEV